MSKEGNVWYPFCSANTKVIDSVKIMDWLFIHFNKLLWQQKMKDLFCYMLNQSLVFYSFFHTFVAWWKWTRQPYPFSSFRNSIMPLHLVGFLHLISGLSWPSHLITFSCLRWHFLFEFVEISHHMVVFSKYGLSCFTCRYSSSSVMIYHMYIEEQLGIRLQIATSRFSFH